MEKCIFCDIANEKEVKEKSRKVYEDRDTFAFLDINPATKYHALVITKKHYEDIFNIPIEELKNLISTVKKVADLYKDKLGIHNVQIINNSGSEAQQEISHIHFHIVPRKSGDGQNIKWTKHPEFIKDKEYDDFVKKFQ